MRGIVVVVTMLGCGRIAFDPRDLGGDAAPAARGCVEEVTAVGDQKCVRRTDGQVWCWGDNDVGNLGDGSISASRAVPGPSLVTDAIQLGSGETHACAVRTSGELVCWGSGTTGQLGDGAGVSRAIPTAVALPAAVVEVRGGQFHTCARLADGTGWCWGRNGDGQLGSAASPQVLAPRPAPIGDATQLALSDDVTCMLRPDQTVACVGTNLGGELGDGGTTSRSTPMQVMAINDPVAAIGGGCHRHVCAVTTVGDVWCWGQNLDGQIGTGQTSVAEPIPRRVGGLPAMAQVAVGHLHTCARSRAGEIWCWGSNDFGQLGNGSFTAARTPTRVLGLTGTPVDLQASCSSTHLVRDDKTLVAWGAAGGLGTGDATDRPTPVEVPMPCE